MRTSKLEKCLLVSWIFFRKVLLGEITSKLDEVTSNLEKCSLVGWTRLVLSVRSDAILKAGPWIAACCLLCGLGVHVMVRVFGRFPEQCVVMASPHLVDEHSEYGVHNPHPTQHLRHCFECSDTKASHPGPRPDPSAIGVIALMSKLCVSRCARKINKTIFVHRQRRLGKGTSPWVPRPTPVHEGQNCRLAAAQGLLACVCTVRARTQKCPKSY